ncbi:MAG: histidinol-phosphate aminotransferase family protein [Mogibacterium sp.]|nr:histidinol-phosphate aminotransferase family protein [Mogibacterium sp.]
MDTTRRLKIKKQLLDHKKISYAMDHIVMPIDGVDCCEGCNPYGFPTECEDVLRSFDPAGMGAYPHSQAMYAAIIDYWKDQCNIERENILLTDGSISALYIINSMFDTHNAVALGISPQFTDYYMNAEMIGIEYAPYQLRKENNYKFELDEFMAMHYQELAEEDKIGVREGLSATASGKSYNFIYIDNPNNPTGQCIDIADIETIVAEARNHDITVIIDEAYGDYMGITNSAVQLCEKYSNLVVVRTMSKGFGLAGLRVGYIIACKELISYMNKLVNPYMVSELAREVAAVALAHGEVVEESKRDFAGMKSAIRDVLGCTEMCPAGNTGSLHMAETLDTNSLLLVYHDDPEINLYEEFWKRGVLVVDGYDFKGLDSTAARIRLPIGDEFPVLLRAIREINEL